MYGLLQERIQIKISQKKCTGQNTGEGPNMESGCTTFLAFVCDNVHRVLPTKEAQPNFNV